MLLLFGGQFAYQVMFRGDDHEGGTENSIRPRRENLQLLTVVTFNVEEGLCTGGAADPVALLRFQAVRVLDPVQAFQQAVGVGGDAQ